MEIALEVEEVAASDVVEASFLVSNSDKTQMEELAEIIPRRIKQSNSSRLGKQTTRNGLRRQVGIGTHGRIELRNWRKKLIIRRWRLFYGI
jgi:hypothetical protein